MSVIDFITSGGMCSISADLEEQEQEHCKEVVKSFAQKVRDLGRELQMPASLLRVNQAAYLFVGKDAIQYHFVFVQYPGANTIKYRDLTSYGTVEIHSIVQQLGIDVGDVIWAFSVSAGLSTDDTAANVEKLAQQYVEAVREAKKPTQKVSQEAVSSPEIAPYDKFRKDHPVGQKTAFIMMQLSQTRPHKEIVGVIQEALEACRIRGLRADDKEYADDLFANVKTYMHACDFGVAVFERITEDQFNPNVSLEVGYMLGLGKSVLLLKDKTLKTLQTDLTGKLYKQFDTTDAAATIPPQVEKWLKDRGLM